MSFAVPAVPGRIALIVEYDGSQYHGSQYQDNALTVQAELELALEKITGEKTRIAVASRTDAGVHAQGQAVSFMSNSSFLMETWVNGLNFYLSPDIAIKAAYRVGDDFNVRRDAWSREYRYCILNRPSRSPLRRRSTYLVPQVLDIEAMNYASEVLIGERDFAPFSGLTGGGTYRRVFRAEFRKKDDLVIFDIEANSFLPHQVRNTVGGLVRVGLGKMEVGAFRTLAQSGQPGAIGPAAPAQGLCLMKVNYEDFPPYSCS